MATKSTTRKAPAKKSSRSRASGTKTVAAKSAGACTVKECLEQHPVLRFHATILTALSLVVCLLVAVLIISLTD